MRLDHLLSREQGEPKGEPSNRGRLRKRFRKRRQAKSRKAKAEGRARNCPKKKLSPLLCIVFRVSALKDGESRQRILTTAQEEKRVLERPVAKRKSIDRKIVTKSQDSNQAKKSTGWMPRHQAPKKDVASCEKQRGVASRHRSVDVRMGKPGYGKHSHFMRNPYS